MKKRFCIILILVLIILFLMNSVGRALSFEEMEDILFKRVRVINDKRIQENNRFNEWDRASDERLRDRVKYLGYYAKNRDVYKGADFEVNNIDYHWKQMWKDLIAIVWIESWFVNEKMQDDGLGFGYGALHWSTAKDMADVYGWEYEGDSVLLNDDKVQAKYIVGYLIWLKNYYNRKYEGEYSNNHLRGMAISGYNMGLWLGMDYEYTAYYNSIAGRRNTIDKWLEKKDVEEIKFDYHLELPSQ